MHQAGSIANVGSGNGCYFISDGNLYLRTSTGGPPAAGQEFRIPSQNPDECFVYGATPACELTVVGIEVYFGHHDLNVSGAGSYRVAGCKFFGAGNSGILAVGVPVGIEEECEYAANANDGSSPVNEAAAVSHTTVLNAWSHDNGDEGHSIHERCRGDYFGGVYEYNASGGITPAIGARAVILGAYTRRNAGGISPAVNPPVHVFASGWTSDGDFDALDQWTGGLATVVDSKVMNLQRYGFVGVVGTARISVFNTPISGGELDVAGAGSASTVLKTGRVESIWDVVEFGSDVYDAAGNRYWPPLANQLVSPFESRVPNGRIEIQAFDDRGFPVTLLREDFTLGIGGVPTVSGGNPQGLRLTFDPLTGIFSGTYRDRANPDVSLTFDGIFIQEVRRGWGHSTRNGASDAVVLFPL
jgi:hypothetical protein